MADDNLVDVDRVLGRISERTDPPYGAHGCLLWIGATWHNGLYGVMTNPFYNQNNAQPKRIGIHRSVYVLNHHDSFPNGELPRENADGHRLHVSHLCHTTLCVNIEHLVLEAQTLNNERKSCKTLGYCLKYHEPYCLL